MSKHHQREPASLLPATTSRAGFLCRLLLRRLSLSGRRSLRSFLWCRGFFSTRRGCRRFLFCRLFVGIASVVSGIESRSLEDQTSAGAEKALHFSVSPLRQPAELFRAFPKGFVTHRLERVEVLAALLTRILVGWHEFRCFLSGGNGGKSALNNLQFNLKPRLDS
jgi:hypothetical protein